MAQWTQIPDATFDPDRPILGSTHLAIVRNFEAMAEGAEGAPRIIPAGIIAYIAKDSPPNGYLKANGAAVSRSVYDDLFEAIGTTFGSGDGSTTFNLPDLRGEFIRGWDDGRNVDSGRSFGSAQGDAFRSHNHTITSDRFDFGETGFIETSSGGLTLTSNNRGGDETRPRNVALLAIIKY